MARILTAYLKREDVPARKALQQAIDKLSFPLTVDHGYEAFETSGYLPCTLDGEDAGFDLRFREISAEVASGLASQGDFATRDTAMICKWGGDPREEASALIVGAALVKDFHALARRDEDAFLTVEQLLEGAKAVLV